MKAFKGQTVEFKEEKDRPEVMLVYSVQGPALLGKIKRGDDPYILRTEQNAQFSSEQLAEISEGMNKLEATRKAAQSH